MTKDRRIIPVPMFHSVGLNSYPWAWNYLSVSVAVFEGFLKRLSAAGLRAIGLAELQAHVRGEIPPLRDAVVLTFDDGYLDNWVYVAPLLRRYGMRGTVFVTPEFVDPGEGCRPTLEDVWRGDRSVADLRPAGFMNWDELRRLDGEGILEVQSHAMTHTWRFTGPKIVGWHCGERHSTRPWLAWNARPDRKPFYMVEDQSAMVPLGHPIFQNRQALVARAFCPNQEAIDAVASYVERHGGRSFFERPTWERELNGLVRAQTDGCEFPGSFETDGDQETRIRREILGSREVLGRELSKRIDYICWPAGGSDDRCENIARECGYLGWTLRSDQERNRWNSPGGDPKGFVRVGASRYIDVRGQWRREADAGFLMLQMQAHRRSTVHVAGIRVRQLGALLAPSRSLG